MSSKPKFSSLLIVAFLSIASLSYSQDKKAKTTSKTTEINQIVNVACGQCQFKLTTQKGCDLAIRIDGKAYFVDGSGIDDHGDAHADDGFCNAVRKAEVKGTIVKGRFKATLFKLLPDK